MSCVNVFGERERLMNMICKTMLMPVLLVIASAVQAEDAGKAEYMNACASCHGKSGAGDGPFAEFMTIDVPSVTGLSAANDGQFPMLTVIHTIDGRQGVRGHGGPMPIWGARFSEELQNTGSYGVEPIVRGRILSLAYYLESIQE